MKDKCWDQARFRAVKLDCCSQMLIGNKNKTPINLIWDINSMLLSVACRNKNLSSAENWVYYIRNSSSDPVSLINRRQTNQKTESLVKSGILTVRLMSTSLVCFEGKYVDATYLHPSMNELISFRSNMWENSSRQYHQPANPSSL